MNYLQKGSEKLRELIEIFFFYFLIFTKSSFCKMRKYAFFKSEIKWILIYIICLIIFISNNKAHIPNINLQNLQQNEKFEPLFSIIIPCYQRKDFISTSLKSCIENQYLIECNLYIEIILVDDNSTDGTLEEIYSLQKRYESDSKLKKHIKFKIISNKRHRGALYIRIVGLKAAEGKYLLNLDSDDEFVPGIFRRLRTLINNRLDIDLIQFRILICDLKESNNNVTYDKKTNKKQYTYKLFSYISTFSDIQKSVTYDNHIKEMKFNIINDFVNKTNDVDHDSNVRHPSIVELRKMVKEKKIMWNLPSLIFNRNLIQKAFDSNLFDKNVYNLEISIHEDLYISYVLLLLVNNYYFLDEIGYIYYRGTPRVKRKRNLRAIGTALTKLNITGSIPKFKI